MSLGGYGTLDFVGTYPERVAAAMALCGGSTLKDFSGMGKVPIWIMHGTADKAVSINQSKKIVKQLQDSGNNSLLLYDWFKGILHGGLARVLYMKQTCDWLFSHSLNGNPREVDRQIPIDSSDFSHAYEDLTPEETKFDIVSEIKRR